ncbi:MAG: enoyl-ACP reductase FabI, partial [Candidatus Binataceae bacterium]
MGIADGKRALVIGVANDKSLAWSIAQELHTQGAEVALTYQGEVLEKRVRPLAQQIGARVVGELDVSSDSQILSVMSTLKECWGGLDMLVHAVAFAEREDLRDRFLNVSRINFARALEISAYSLVALARAAEPLMEARGGGAIVTMSYLGAVRAIPNYNVMGVAKAALEACVRYLALDLGAKNI